MADKTKAAMPGRQCNNTKHIQDTRVNAGGQRMSQRNSAPADFIQLFCKAFSHPGRNTSRSLLPQRIFVVKQDFKRKAATIKTAAKIIIFSLLILLARCRVIVALCGLFALSRQPATHHHLAAGPVPLAHVTQGLV